MNLWFPELACECKLDIKSALRFYNIFFFHRAVHPTELHNQFIIRILETASSTYFTSIIAWATPNLFTGVLYNSLQKDENLQLQEKKNLNQLPLDRCSIADLDWRFIQTVERTWICVALACDLFQYKIWLLSLLDLEHCTYCPLHVASRLGTYFSDPISFSHKFLCMRTFSFSFCISNSCCRMLLF